MGLESTLHCGLLETWKVYPSYSSLWVKHQPRTMWVTASFGNMDPLYLYLTVSIISNVTTWKNLADL